MYITIDDFEDEKIKRAYEKFITLYLTCPPNADTHCLCHYSRAMNNYELLNVIGRGSFGTVSKARRKRDGKILCAKALNYSLMVIIFIYFLFFIYLFFFFF